MANKTSHQLSKEFISQFWKEFQEIESKLPCKHRDKNSFELSCDPCLVFILPTASEMFAASVVIFEMMEAFVGLSNFFTGANDNFNKLTEKVFQSEKIKIPNDVLESQKKAIELMAKTQQSILNNEFLNPKKFSFYKEHNENK